MRKFKTRDSALAFYINQLENLDQRLYMPLYSVTWGRDIKLRAGITMSDESTSFIRSTLAAAGTQNNIGNMPWISAETTAIPGVSINGAKIVLQLRLLAREVSYTSVELERSARTGQSIDAQKMDALNILYQMNTDQMVYIGSSDVNATGLVNDAGVNTSNVVAGIGGSTFWENKTADEILADVNTLIANAWERSAYAICPSKLMLPPKKLAYISTQKVSSAGNVSILKYLKDNCISMETNGRELEIVPVKWLTGRGVGDTNRMVAYTNEEQFVRFPMVPIRRETPYYLGIRYIAPYIWAFGEVEVVYTESIAYADGI